jgi:hypothetical protein
MIRHATTWIRLSIALGLVVASGCSSSRGSDLETVPDSEDASLAGETIVIEVLNDLAPPRSVIVTFQATGQIERQLGTVLTGETATFAVDQRHGLPPYQLVAEPSGAGGGRVVSRPIDVATAARITWSLATNFVRVDG